jgi:hypothetical protein
MFYGCATTPASEQKKCLQWSNLHGLAVYEVMPEHLPSQQLKVGGVFQATLSFVTVINSYRLSAAGPSAHVGLTSRFSGWYINRTGSRCTSATPGQQTAMAIPMAIESATH